MKENKLMVWSSWKGALFLLLASVGLAFGQQATVPTIAHKSNEIYMTVQEPGKPSQKCRVLYFWNLNKGGMACQVQTLDSGEMITVVNPPPMPNETEIVNGNPILPVSTRIFRWGSSKICPPGCPQPQPMDVTYKDIKETKTVQTTKLQAVPLPSPVPAKTTTQTKKPAPPKILVGPVDGPAKSAVELKNFKHSIITPPDPKPLVTVKLPPPPPAIGILKATDKKTETSKAKTPSTVLANQAMLTPPPPAPVTKKTEVAKLDLTGLPKNNVEDKLKKSTKGTKSFSILPPPPPPSLPKLPTAPLTVPEVKGIGQRYEDRKPEKVARGGQEMRFPALPVTAKKEPTIAQDPLENPINYSPPEAKKRYSLFGNKQGQGKDVTLTNHQSSSALPAPQTHVPQLPTGGKTTFPAPQTHIPQLPPGARSVIAAGEASGNPGQVQYIPVPIMTVPPSNQPPPVPPSQVPQAPQPNAFVNAFTPAGNEGMQNQQGPVYNAWSSPAGPGNYQQMDPRMVATQQYYAQLQAQGYIQQQVPNMYQGPRPPMNTYPQSNVAQAGYQQPGNVQTWVGNTYGNPAMDRGGMVTGQAMAQMTAPQAIYSLLETLKTAMYPAQREWAAINLAQYDWRHYPQIAQGLLTAAEQDPAPLVRVGCINSLRRMGVNPGLLAPTMQRLKTDSDPRVRQAADEVLHAAGVSSSNGIQPASATRNY